MTSHRGPVDGATAWYAVGLLAVAYLISIVDRFAISLLVTPIKQDLQISDLHMGLLLGLAFGLFYSLVGQSWLRRCRAPHSRSQLSLHAETAEG